LSAYNIVINENMNYSFFWIIDLDHHRNLPFDKRLFPKDYD